MLWFLLNVVFLVAVASLVIQAQLRLELDSLLSGSVGDRLQALSEHLVVELRDRPRDEWGPTLKSLAEAHHAQFAILANDGAQLAGEIATPPPEMLARMPAGRDRAGGPRPPPGGPPGAPDGFFDPMRGPPPRLDDGPRSYRKFLLRAGSPSQYWIGIEVPILDHDSEPPRPTTLLIAMRSLGSSGLLFDFKPWLLAGAGVLVCSVLFWIPLVAGSRARSGA